ncbi:extracellular solute-binding protein [Nonomuraea sp. NPDC049421]|uniref:extracellular solute-binding protein n=1 Tax=Nonomuraea sp. NPDC049421 TaxID=3155275 RepID=UPI003440681B
MVANSGAVDRLAFSADGRYVAAGSTIWDLTDPRDMPVGVALMPEGPAGRAVNLNGLAEAVYAKSKHPEEAMKLAAWLGTEQPQKMMADGGYVFPVITGLAQGYVAYWKAKKLDVSPFLEEPEGTTFPVPIITRFTGFETKLNQIFNEMYLGKLSPQQAADQAVSEGNASIK